MANELKHKDAGTNLTRTEDNATDRHSFDSQAVGDILYASSTTVLSRLAKGTEGHYLKQGATIPEWAAGTVLTIAETQVYNAASPVAWTDLDLSATIGANPALVLLKICATPLVLGTVSVRRNGDADEFYGIGQQGVACGTDTVAAAHLVLLVATDAAGIIEWTTANARDPTTVDIIAYIQ